MERKTALFCISSLGLGHAGRMVALIWSYIGTHDIHIMSTGNALDFLRKEFAASNISFYDCRDYPPLERGRNRGLLFYWYLAIDSIATIYLIKREHSFVKKLCAEIRPEFIISDGRYGSHIDGIPSFIVSHQISFIMPRGLDFFQGIADSFNFKTFSRFNAVIIPDYEKETDSLAGRLSHHPMLSKLDYAYVGILSPHARKKAVKDIDYMFTISGYLVEHRPTFVKNLLEQAKGLSGKKVFVLGNAKDNEYTTLPEFNIEIFSSVSGKLREDFFSRAKCLVSRSGYTTVMDLAELGIPGFLVPTPGQSEQEYLAAYLAKKNYAVISLSEDFNLKDIASKIGAVTPIQIPWGTQRSVEMIHDIVSEHRAKKAA